MKIAAKTVRYIKLGRGGQWEDAAITRGELHFGYKSATHELALEGDAAKIKGHLIELGGSPQAAARDAQEVLDFYQLGPDCLWITFAKDHLWWAFADPQVIWANESFVLTGERTRKTIDGWRSSDINGKPLKISSLSTKLTKVSAYRRTICAVAAQDYLLRRINGLDEPIIVKSAAARTAMIAVLSEALAALHWKDFETLVDILFVRSGWHRISAVGGAQKTTDLQLEQPTTNELAAVQVKSVASQKTLDDYIERIDAADQHNRFFFVCHSPKGDLVTPADRDDVHVWAGEELAAIVLKLGLLDWVLEKVT